MPSYVQIDDDPTRWYVSDGVSASQVTGQSLMVEVDAPIVGTLVISAKAASVAIFDTNSPPPTTIMTVPDPTIYVPTATGANAQHGGYELAANFPEDLAQQIQTAMQNGHSVTVPLAGGGTLVLSGATLSFVVLKMPSVGDSSQHG
ncbi:MAG TPA: hypothetical protein VIX15_17175 [Streptosporangiaceae bacterium]